MPTLWPKMEGPRVHFGPPENRESLKNRTFEARSAPGPSKNGLREGFGKNMKINEKRTGKREVLGEENMPKPCKGHRFQGFSVFRKSRKINAKRAPKINCSRGATPPHPKDTGHLK